MRGSASPKAVEGKEDTDMFVLDASVTLAWLFEDETNVYADAVSDALEEASAVVPPIWPLEVVNAFLAGERRKRVSAAGVAAFIRLLGEVPIVTDDVCSIHAFSDTLSLARLHRLSAYDAAYLELALRRGLPLATLDGTLRKAAKEAGIPIFAA